MKFISTRNNQPSGQQSSVSFAQALFRGIAPDGGLYQPLETPKLRDLLMSFNGRHSFVDIATALSAALLSDEIPPADAAALAEQAFPFSPRLTASDPTILELFHGPSYAFKDFGASYLAACMEYFLSAENSRAVILTATSGDTGSAVAQAFYRRQNIDVVILYPGGRVSPGQEKQLTTLGENIHALEVRGNFDDCQRMVKEAFLAPELQHLPLTSANSINVGRLIPQSFYYVYAFSQIRESLGDDKLHFVVPSGNFGNLTAGIYAWRWGLPVAGFVAATNTNDIVPQYLETGVFSPRPSLQTYANAMDVGNPSNFERILMMFQGSRKKMQEKIRPSVVSDEEILKVMRDVYESTGMFVCPHTATGILSAERFRKHKQRFITLATAHPAKFNEVVEKACGKKVPLPAGIAASMKKPKKSININNTLNSLSLFLNRLDKN